MAGRRVAGQAARMLDGVLTWRTLCHDDGMQYRLVIV
jgi:hypothetical protein